MKKIGQAYRLLTRNWRQMIEFEGLYKILSFFVFTPLFFGMLNYSMEISGYTYLTAENFKEYLTNPVTIAMLVLLLFCIMLYSLFDISAIIYILDQSHQKKSTTLVAILKSAFKNTLKTIIKGNWRIALLVLVMIPFLNLGLTSSYISSISIPEFIQEYISKHWYLAAALVFAGILLVIFLIRWMYSFHYYILEGCRFKEACRRSRDLNKGKKIRDFLIIIFMQIFFAVFYAAIVALAVMLALFIERRFNSYGMTYTVMTVLSYVLVSLTLVIFTLFTVPVSYSCITVLFYYRKEQKQEEIVHFEEIEINEDKHRRKKRHVLEGLVIVFGLIGSAGYIYAALNGKNNINIEYLKTMEVTAHRGASIKYPENTMLAFEGAEEQGADWIELDVQQTRDGKIIVMHDTNLKRTTGLNQNIWDTDYETIENLEAGSFKSDEFAGEPIPLLSDVLAFADDKNVRLNIELKPTGHETDFEKSVVDLIEEQGMEENCVVTSQEYQVLEHVKDYNEEIQTVYVMSMAYGNVLNLEDADAFSIEASFVSERLVTKIHNEGKQIYAWTVNSQSGINRMAGLNVDNIITDNVPLAVKCIYEKKDSNFMLEYVRALLNL